MARNLLKGAGDVRAALAGPPAYPARSAGLDEPMGLQSRPAPPASAAKRAALVPSAPAAPRGGSRAWAVAVILACLSTISFLDRQVLALLVSDLSRDLRITDVQFGVLTGPAFILVYNLTLLPAALMVDRWNRKWLISAGAVIWTLMTIASAFAQTFHQLVLLRAGLAFGEALLGPAAISLIGDLFDRLDRPLPTAAYITGSVVGATGSAMISAAVLQLAGIVSQAAPHFAVREAWRLTLIGVGLPGLALGLLLIAVAREPVRATEASEPGSLETLASHLRRRGLLYGGVFVGYGLLGMVTTALAIWGPTYLIRSFHLTPVRAGYLLGGVSLAAGLAGTLALPAIFRNRIRAGATDQVIQLTLAAILVTVAAALAGGFTASLAVCLACFGVAVFLLMGIGTLPTLIIQLYTPSQLRGRISAALFFLLYLLSSGIAPVLVPLVAHGAFHGQAAVGRSIGVIALVAGAAAAASFAAVRRILKRAEVEVMQKAGLPL